VSNYAGFVKSVQGTENVFQPPPPRPIKTYKFEDDNTLSEREANLPGGGPYLYANVFLIDTD
jgi:hypothetical protein